MFVRCSVGKVIDFCLAAAGVVGWLWWFGPLFKRLGMIVLSPDGDGLKNTFTFIWQVVHGTSYTEFTGMNAPFGEHICYTDGHPWLAALMQATGPWTTAEALAVLNGFTLLALPLSAGAFLLLFRTLGERQIVRTLPIAIALAFMQPAVMRLGGHFALNHIWMFIGSWALWRQWRKNPKRWGVLIALFLLQTLAWFTHAYLGAMSSGFILLASGFEALHRRSWTLGWPAVASLGALAIFRGFIFATDEHVGRIEHPTGFWRAHAEVLDWLVPIIGPTRSLIDLAGPLNLTWEASAYLGAGTLVVLLTLAIQRRRAELGRYEVLAALVLGMVALGMPWRWMPELLEVMPVFKQFRAVGRFAWPMVAVAGVAAAWSIRHRPWMLRLLVLSWLIEGGALLQMASTWSAPSPFLDHPPSVPSGVRAILPLPFTHYGSEAHSLPRKEESMRVATVIAQATGVPLMAANLTRVSIPEARAQLAQFGRPGATRFGLPLDGPVWIVRTTEPLRAHEALRFRDRPDSVRTPLEVAGCVDAYPFYPQQWDERPWPVEELIWSEEGKGNECWSGVPKGRTAIMRIPLDSLPKGRYAIRTWWSSEAEGGFNNRFEWQLLRKGRKIAWAFPEEAVSFEGEWRESMTEFDHRENFPPHLELAVKVKNHHHAKVKLHRVELRPVKQLESGEGDSPDSN